MYEVKNILNFVETLNRMRSIEFMFLTMMMQKIDSNRNIVIKHFLSNFCSKIKISKSRKINVKALILEIVLITEHSKAQYL